MEKITRVLILYAELMKGEEVNKTVFCFRYNCSHRTFERDIQDIRLFLSELFSFMELSYNKINNTYFIEGAKRGSLEPLEYLFVEGVLKDTAVLRKDELEKLLAHLLLHTENSQSLGYQNEMDYLSPAHNKALLKIYGDLVSIIAKKKYIKMRYFKENGDEIEQNLIPCTIKFDFRYIYLIACQHNESGYHPTYYRLDKIYSFDVIRNQTSNEREKVTDFLKNYRTGIIQIYGGEYIEVYLKCEKEFYPYLYDRFKNANIEKQNENMVEVRIIVIEDDFLKWLVSQPQDNILILHPTSTKYNLVELAHKIIAKYGGTE